MTQICENFMVEIDGELVEVSYKREIYYKKKPHCVIDKYDETRIHYTTMNGDDIFIENINGKIYTSVNGIELKHKYKYIQVYHHVVACYNSKVAREDWDALNKNVNRIVSDIPEVIYAITVELPLEIIRKPLAYIKSLIW